ncbi:MAG TPA: nucleotide exchange factor GrpE [Paludibacteraceae bacterium]|jgi:molecular chaperone GrpE|nr:nucleotide exchange factor GrpE [Paludibacteraceae bacterium]HOO24097.1 nucleotide exchange factor GrpE [Paludibacteraceae bacterium]HOS37569.1 nucleotide exchange factor GrpE [Paludibacteraceae bacterium]HPD27590.1 nucleotide exchange factor GrpE [Paludibacteraceae bacterium]HPK20222.1 nucleotide exchange factor GrpE [Paludibacteraceae bacterium]
MKENKKKKEKIKVESAQSDTESTEKVEETASSQQTEQSADDFEAKFNDVNDKYLRLMAEFDNYRKRMMKEKSDWIKTSSERILIDILPIIDNFERSLKAMENAENVAALKEGVDLIYSQMMTFLKQNGVSVVATENEPFDMNIHEAVTTIPAPTEEQKGKIIDCVQKGYQLYDKVIRFPKVVVGE